MAKESSKDRTAIRRAVWPALLAIVLLAVSYWLMHNKTSTSTNSTTTQMTKASTPAHPKPEVTQLTPIKNPKPSPVQKVMYGSGVFSPTDLTVKKGTTVLFATSDGTRFHLISTLPGFDSVSDVAQYAFTFSQPGTFEYHNADNPPQAGQVTVTP